MFQRDYMLRLIEQMTQAVGAALGLKQHRDPLAALQQIDELLKRLLGLNPKLVHSLSDEALLDLLRRGPDGGPDKLLMVALLLKEEGDCKQMLGEFDVAFNRHRRALMLYLAAASDGAERTYINYPHEIGVLLETLRRYELPVAIRQELWRYHMAEGQFADGENELFALLDDGHGGDSLLADAVAHYERLQELDAERLEAGGLSAAEVEDALEQLRGRLKPRTD